MSAPTSSEGGPRRSGGHAIVKKILSGDSMILMGSAPKGGVAPEKQIVLSGIQTPKCARNKSQVDEVAYLL
jgi:hypothetical protein